MALNAEDKVKPKKYYVGKAIISALSLILFLNDDLFPNAKMLVTSSVIILAPYVMDFLTFRDDTKESKKDPFICGLRVLSGFAIFIISLGIFLGILVFLDVLQTPENGDLLCLAFKPDGRLAILNKTFLSKLLCVDRILTYHVVVFVGSTLLALVNTHFLKNRK